MMSFSIADVNIHVLIITYISSVRQNESWLLQNITWSVFKAGREEGTGCCSPSTTLGWGIRKDLFLFLFILIA